MQTLIVSPTLKVVLYDSIEEFPVNAESEARQYATIRSSLPSNAAELEAKQERIDLYDSLDKKAEAHRERANYRLAEKLIADGYNALELEWACYVHSVNDVRSIQLREDDLVDLVKKLKTLGLTDQLIVESLDQVKQQMEEEVKRSFPNRINKGRKLNTFVRYKAYGEALADYYMNPNEETKAALDKATISMLATQDIYSFANDHTNVLEQIKTAQRESYMILTECGVASAKDLTVYEYYGWIDMLEKRYEAQKPQNPPNGKR